MYKFQRKKWEDRLREAEKNMLRFFNAPQESIDKADGSFLMNAFLRGWQCRARREQ